MIIPYSSAIILSFYAKKLHCKFISVIIKTLHLKFYQRGVGHENTTGNPKHGIKNCTGR